MYGRPSNKWKQVSLIKRFYSLIWKWSSCNKTIVHKVNVIIDIQYLNIHLVTH